MKKVRNQLAGRSFGKLYVESFSHVNDRGNACWVCLCECGRRTTVIGTALTSGNTGSCGNCDGKKQKPNGSWRLTEEQKQAMVREYLGGDSCATIGRRYGVHPVNVRINLKRRGVTLRPSAEACRTCSLNQAAFDTLSPEVCYWAGFLITDGVLYEGKRATVLGLSLAVVDEKHVLRFRDFLGSDHAVYHRERKPGPIRGKNYTSQPEVSLRIAIPKVMAGRVKSLGIVPRKTHVAEAPPEVENSADFWRGCIDGDGSVSLLDREGLDPQPVVSLCGASKRLLEQFATFVRRHTPDWEGTVPAKKNQAVYRVGVYGSYAIDLVRVLYPPGCVALERKEATARQIIARADADPMWCKRERWTERREGHTRAVVGLYTEQHKTIRDIAGELGIGVKAVRGALVKAGVPLRTTVSDETRERMAKARKQWGEPALTAEDRRARRREATARYRAKKQASTASGQPSLFDPP